jgi:hypothetical protein
MGEEPLTQSRPFVTRGSIGWGNRKAGVEAYGPGGRWAGPIELPNRSNTNVVYGDLLGDHIEEMGGHEGSYLVVIVVPSRFGSAEADRLLTAAKDLVGRDDHAE